MATVPGSGIWIHTIADRHDMQVFDFVTSYGRNTVTDTRVEVMASGRLRGVRRAGTRRPWSLAFQACTQEQTAWLETHAGELVMVRDDRGGKVYGVYAEVPVDEHRYNVEADVAISLAEVSYDEAV